MKLKSGFIFILLASCVAFAGDPVMPDSKLTPGDADPNVTQSNIEKTICVKGYTKGVRNVPQSEKTGVFKRYSIKFVAGRYEVDHLISLELGGSNKIENLWPESYAPAPGAHEKDKVENDLHRRVCNGELSLKEAQQIISKNWLAYYQQRKGQLHGP